MFIMKDAFTIEDMKIIFEAGSSYFPNEGETKEEFFNRTLYQKVYQNPTNLGSCKLKYLWDLAYRLELELYNQTPTYFCIRGINGHSTVIKENSTEEDIKKHIFQMGRDSLKMELNSLLDITRHN